MEKIKKKKKYKIPKVFIAFLCLFIAILIVLMLLGWSYAEKILIDYETHLPQSVLDKYFDKLKNQDYSDILKLSEFKENEFTKEEHFKEYVNTIFEDKYDNLEYIKTKENLEKGTAEYSIYLEDVKKSEIFMQKTGSKSKYGFDEWEIESIDKLTYLGSLKITIPPNSKVYVNNVELDESYILYSEYQDFEQVSTDNEFLDMPRNYTYHITEKLLVYPEIKVISPEGDDCIAWEIDNSLSLIYTMPDAHKDEIVSLAKDAAKTYSRALQNQVKMSEFAKYLLPSTKLYKDLQKFNDWTIEQPTHTGEEFSEFIINNYKEYSDRQISLELEFDYIVYTKNTNKNIFSTNLKFYFVKINNEWKISDMKIL